MSRPDQLDRRTKAMLKQRRKLLPLLHTMPDAVLLGVLVRMVGARSHSIMCKCGGVNEATGLSCREVWEEVERRAR